MARTRQRFRKNNRFLVLALDIFHLDSAVLDHFTDSVVLDVNMFDTRMCTGIKSEAQGALIVAVNPLDD